MAKAVRAIFRWRPEGPSIPSSNQLEALKGDRKGEYSIRINKQWRICFRWRDGHVFDVEIVTRLE
jgi:plasmid maintenance system killer protein